MTFRAFASLRVVWQQVLLYLAVIRLHEKKNPAVIALEKRFVPW
jgi:hypothetical protein